MPAIYIDAPGSSKFIGCDIQSSDDNAIIVGRHDSITLNGCKLSSKKDNVIINDCDEINAANNHGSEVNTFSLNPLCYYIKYHMRNKRYGNV